MPTLEITTTIGCTMMCTYCPQDKIKGAYGKNVKLLSLEDFKTILAKVPNYVRIDFSGMTEPWLNPHCTDMLQHTLEAGYHTAIYTTLVGMNDPKPVTDLLRDHRDQVECVVLHLPDNRGNMRGFTRTPQWERALRAFTQLNREGGVQEFRTMAMGQALPDLEDEPSPDQPPEWSGCDRAGSLNTDHIGQQPVTTAHHETPVSCSYTPFYDQNVLLPNGDVVLCCMDYELRHKIGNLLRDDYHELFSSPAMGKLRAENTKCGGDGTICKRCDRAIRYKVSEGSKQFWETAA